ncbi:MAG: hypothetical protein V3W41_01845 [Planctomycetota bacterium]
MPDMLRRFFASLAPFAAPLLFLAMLVDFGLSRCLAFLRRIDLGERWEKLTEFQSSWGPFFEQVLLMTAGLALVLLVPGLLRTRRSLKSGLYRLLCLGSLLMLGLSVLRQALGGHQLLAAQDLLLLIGFAISATLILAARKTGRESLLVIVIIMATSLPQLWRLCFDLAGAEVPEGGALDGLRGFADGAVLIAMASLTLISVLHRNFRALAIAAVVSAPFAWVAFSYFEPLRQVLSPVTGIWLSAFPDAIVGILLSLGCVGGLALWIGAFGKKGSASLALGLTLIFLAGFLTVESRHFLALWAGLVICARWAEDGSDAAARIHKLFE